MIWLKPTNSRPPLCPWCHHVHIFMQSVTDEIDLGSLCLCLHCSPPSGRFSQFFPPQNSVCLRTGWLLRPRPLQLSSSSLSHLNSDSAPVALPLTAKQRGRPPSQSSPRERLRTSSLNRCCCPHRTDPHDLKVNTKQQQALSKIAAFKMALNYSGSEDTALHPHPLPPEAAESRGPWLTGTFLGPARPSIPRTSPPSLPPPGIQVPSPATSPAYATSGTK